MNYPKVIFEDTRELRAQYLTYLAKQIACGFYQDRRFLVLPRLVKKESRAIYFPDIKYPKTLWNELCKYTSEDFDWFFPEKIVKLIQGVMTGSDPCQNKGLTLKGEWKKKEKQFFDCVAEFLPKFDLKKINFIKVLPVEFGTV